MNPDHHIEEFWLGFKQSMKNFYGTTGRNIDRWSFILNDLQQQRNYEEIEKNIRNYISLYAIDVMKSNNTYHAHILGKNIKRWNELSLKFAFSSEKTYYNKIFMLFDIFYKNCQENDNTIFVNELMNMFQDVELFVIYDEFKSLIDISIKYEKPNILDKLGNFVDVIEYVNNKFYPINIRRKLSGTKIIKEIHTIKTN